MFTVCPKCDLTLTITARDLRAAHGHVRCGRCQNVFNALESLTDEHPRPPPHAVATKATDTIPDRAQETSPTRPDTETTVEVAAVTEADEAPLPEAELSVEQVAAMMAGAEQPTAEPADPARHAAATFEFETTAEDLATDDDVERSEPEVDPLEAPLPTSTDRPGQSGAASESAESPGPTAEAPEASLLAGSDPPRAWAGWAVGAALLALALALQVVNHYRDSLATLPAFAGPLRTVYAAFGVDLTPNWDVHAYVARQLGATMGGADREITVRASIANLAQQAQPLPLLRVILQDRFGRPVAARDVEPSAYLRSLPSPPLLAPGARVDASTTFISPGPQVVGFEIDACLRRDGTVVCAHGS